MSHRKVVTISDEVYKSFMNIATKYGIKVNELMSAFLNYFDLFKDVIEREIKSAEKGFRGLTRGDLFTLIMDHIIYVAKELYEVFSEVLRHFGFLDKGFIIEDLTPTYRDPLRREGLVGIYAHFIRSRYSNSLIDEVAFWIGVEEESNGFKWYHPRGGALLATTKLGYRNDLGKKFEIIRENLERVLREDEEVQDALDSIKSAVCDQCDRCDVEARVDANEDLLVQIEVFAEDFACLPSIGELEGVVRLLLRKAGLKRRRKKK
jgi:hypothetical protein